MGLSGNVKTMLLADLLQWLSLGRKKGTLVIAKSGIEKKIFFKDGSIISSASNDPREYLGQFLMSHGHITEDELKRAMEVQEQSRVLLGKILVNIHAISEKELLRLMRTKAEECVYDIFLWKEGEFEFLDDELPAMEMVPLHVDVTGIIMEGTRRVDEWERIREGIKDSTVVPVIQKPIDYSILPEVQKTVILAVNGHRTIAQIILESRSSDFIVSKTVYDFMRAGSIVLVERPAPPPPPVTIALEVETTEEDEVNAFLVRAQTALKANDFEKALRLLKVAQNLDPVNQKVTASLKGTEAVVSGELKKAGIIAAKVPKMAKPFEEMTSMNFNPNEGFILSRINGVWNIGSIIKISPMREIDALLIFFKLFRDEVITLD